MPTSAIVVGSGINGASTAFFLADQGVKVTLIERLFPAGGPTGSSSALTHAFYLEPELSQLAKRGIDILRDLESITGGPSDYHGIGMMWVVGADAAPEWQAAVERITGEGARIEAVSPDRVASEAPGWVTDDVALAVWEPDGGYADPATSTNSLVNGARARGAVLRSNTTVERLLTRGGAVTGVLTQGGETLEADVVVVAAGPWSRALLATAEVDVPLTVERHPMAILSTPKRSRVVMPWSWCDDILLNYARPEGNDLVIAGEWSGGGTGHRKTDSGAPLGTSLEFSRAVDLDESAGIVGSFERRIPDIGQESIRPGYADLYDMSPDDLPVIGAVTGKDGLYVVAGSSGHGFKTGPAIGEAVATLITTGQSPLLAPFSIDRFTTAASTA